MTVNQDLISGDGGAVVVIGPHEVSSRFVDGLDLVGGCHRPHAYASGLGNDDIWPHPLGGSGSHRSR